MWGILAYSFVVCLENVIVYPSMWPRLLSMEPPIVANQTTVADAAAERRVLHVALAAAMGSFSGGRAVAALGVNLREHGPWSVRIAGAICFACSMVSAAIYLTAATPIELVLSRIFGGLGAGALSLMIVALTEASSEAERTIAFSRFYFAAGLGEIVGPALIAISAGVNVHIGAPGLAVIDAYNVGGVYSAVLFALACILVFIGFAHIPRFQFRSAAPPALASSTSVNPQIALPVDAEVEATAAQTKTAAATACAAAKCGSVSTVYSTASCVAVLAALLVVNVAIAAWETAISIMGVDYFGWGTAEIAYAFIASGSILFGLNVVAIPLLQRASNVAAKVLRGGNLEGGAAAAAGNAARESGVAAGSAQRARRAMARLCEKQKDALWAVAWALCAAAGATTTLAMRLESRVEGAAESTAPPSLAIFVLGQVLFVAGIFALLTHLSSLYTQLAERACAGCTGRLIGAMRTLSAASRVIGNFAIAAAASATGNDRLVRVLLLVCPIVVLALLALFLLAIPLLEALHAWGARERLGEAHGVRLEDDRVALESASRYASTSEGERAAVAARYAQLAPVDPNLSAAPTGAWHVRGFAGSVGGVLPFERTALSGRTVSSTSQGGLLF